MPAYTSAELKALNKTSRSGGAVGQKAIVPRYTISRLLREPDGKSKAILDYGSGYPPYYTKLMLDLGFTDVTPWDIGDNHPYDCPDPLVLDEYALRWFDRYDVIMASNVLNVQPDLDRVMQVFHELHMLLKPRGFVVMNYPRIPRKAGLSDKEMLACAEHVFTIVHMESKYLWILSKI